MPSWNKRDITGMRFGRLTVIKECDRRQKHLTRWVCKCDCGNEKEINTSDLTSGRTLSCGCQGRENRKKSREKNMIGVRVGKLLVLEKLQKRKGANKSIVYLCLCDCGETTEVITSHLASKKVQSCGCSHTDALLKRNTTHGMRYNGVYHVWNGMIQRCENPKAPNFKNYGGRGIKVCPEWHDPWTFLKDMGDRPSKDHSIERKNVNGNYCPENCCWTTLDVQANNKRNTRLLDYNGSKLTMSQLAKKYRLSYGMIWSRLRKGLSIKEAIETPPRNRIKKS